MSELSEGDAIASDRLEERGFQWLAKVIRGEIVAPEWMIEIMANGPSDRVQSWMITLRSVDQLRRYTAPNFFEWSFEPEFLRNSCTSPVVSMNWFANSRPAIVSPNPGSCRATGPEINAVRYPLDYVAFDELHLHDDKAIYRTLGQERNDDQD